MGGPWRTRWSRGDVAPERELVLIGYGNRPLRFAPTGTAGIDTIHVELEPPVAVEIGFYVRDGDFTTRVGQLTTVLDTVEAVWARVGMVTRSRSAIRGAV